MKTWLTLRVIVMSMVAVVAFAAAACAADEEYPIDDGYGISGKDFAYSSESAVQMAGVSVDQVQSTVVVERKVEAEVAMMEAEEQSASAPVPVAAEDVDEFQSTGDGFDVALQQERIIVRNADMAVQSDDPRQTITEIGELAVSLGGWVVNVSSNDLGFNTITIRVPAETLDSVIDQISNGVVKVESVNSNATDFTEEFIDLTARRNTIQETVDALTRLLSSGEYDDLNDLLEVQREITEWQSEIERIDGRTRFIQESAAFSRLVVSVNRAPTAMRVEIGDDIRTGLGINHRFTARLYPPEGYDNFEITWDFGDGSPRQTTTAALPTRGEEGYLSAPVVHAYGDDDFSPYAVSVRARAFSDSGVAEGESEAWAYVAELPRLAPFVSHTGEVFEDEETTFIASFDHPDSIGVLNYSWDFRDGSNPVQGTVDPGVISTEVNHTFDRWRSEPYAIRFEVWADSEAGEVRETSSIQIWVQPSPKIESSDFAPGSVATQGLNVLIATSSWAANAAIWIGVTLPIWIVAAGVVYGIIWLVRRMRARRRSKLEVSDNPGGANAAGEPSSANTAA